MTGTIQRPLTDRELEVLKLASHGASNKETGRVLELAEATVKVHRKALYRKLGATDITHAVAIALRSKIIE